MRPRESIPERCGGQVKIRSGRVTRDRLRQVNVGKEEEAPDRMGGPPHHLVGDRGRGNEGVTETCKGNITELGSR